MGFWSSLFLALAISAQGHALVEVQAHVLPSVAIIGNLDTVISAHGAAYMGGEALKFGPYVSYEHLGGLSDQALGLGFKVGRQHSIEFCGALLKRQFQVNGQSLQGQGTALSLIYAYRWTPHWGLGLVLSGKRIEKGDLAARTSVDLLPHLHFGWDL